MRPGGLLVLNYSLIDIFRLSVQIHSLSGLAAVEILFDLSQGTRDPAGASLQRGHRYVVPGLHHSGNVSRYTLVPWEQQLQHGGGYLFCFYLHSENMIEKYNKYDSFSPSDAVHGRNSAYAT